jgi:hypothetical protein
MKVITKKSERKNLFPITGFKIKALLFFSMCILSCSLLIGQPNPDCNSEYTLEINYDNIPVCSGNKGSTKFEGDIPAQAPSYCTVGNDINCFKFVFKRSQNLSSTQEFVVEIGQGDGCNGSLKATYLNPLSAKVDFSNTPGGSQTTYTLKFAPNVTTIVLYACVNGKAHITMCVCPKPPPCGITRITCPPAPTTVYDCKKPIPDPLTTIDAFKNAGGKIEGTPCGQLTITSETEKIDNCKSETVKRTYTIKDGNQIYKCDVIYKYAPDKTPPEITIKDSKTDLGCNPKYEDIDKAFGTATATDNCGKYVKLDYSTSDIYKDGCKRWKKRTWKAEDECTNKAEKSVTVYWTEDKEDPKLYVTYHKDGQDIGCNPTNTEIEAAFGKATATDNCGSVTPVLGFGDVLATGCYRRLTRAWKVTDGCGNMAIKSITITWKVDLIAPEIVVSGSKENLGCNPKYEDIDKAFGTAKASDNCDDYVHLEESTSGVYSDGCKRWKIRTWKATDKCWNKAEKSVKVYWIYDATPPKIWCPADKTVACAGDVPAPDVYAIKTEDDCKGKVTVEVKPDVISYKTCANRFMITRKYIAKDECGNEAWCEQKITVYDNTPPKIWCPADKTVTCASDVPAADISAVKTEDNCKGKVTVEVKPDVISYKTCANRFMITRKYIAKDECGNEISCEQKITVYDNIAPEAGNTDLGTIGCYDYLPSANEKWVTAWDNCKGNVQISQPSAWTKQSGYDCYDIYKRTFWISDECWNKKEVYQTIKKQVCPNGGKITPSLTKVCGSQYVKLCLSEGTAIRWEKQYNCTGAWIPINNSQGSCYGFNSEPNTRICYRAVLCNNTYSYIATVITDVPAGGGSITANGSTVLCTGDYVNLSAQGQVGKILEWQKKIDPTMNTIHNWRSIPGTAGATTYRVSFADLDMAMADISYRVLVSSPWGICIGMQDIAYSPELKVTRRMGCVGTGDLRDNRNINNNGNEAKNNGNNVINNTADIPLTPNVPTDNNLIKSKVYPNPSSGKITLDIIGAHEGQAQIEIFDMTGRLVSKEFRFLNFNKNEINLDISTLNLGMYIVKFTDSDKQQSSVRIMKE